MVNLAWLVVALLWIGPAGGATRGAMAAESPPAAATGPQERVLNSVQAVDYADLPGGSIVIRLVFQNELSAPPAVIVSYHPSAHIAFDFANTTNAVGKERMVVGQRGLRSLEVVQAGTRTRLVINLAAPFVHESAVKGKELLITLRRPETTGPGESRKWWSSGATSDAPRHEVRDIVFQKSPSGEGRIIVEQSDAAIPVDIRQQGKVLIVDFLDSGLPAQLERRLDVRDFGTAIQAIETYRLGNHVRMKIELAAPAAYSAYQVSRQFIVSSR